LGKESHQKLNYKSVSGMEVLMALAKPKRMILAAELKK
jgi:hypothetical protein